MRVVILGLLTCLDLAQASPIGDALDRAARQASNLDVDQDGVAELLSIEPLRLAPRLGSAETSHASGAPLALVLVEGRLLAPSASDSDLEPALGRHLEDLRAAGFSARAYRVSMHRDGAHRDGLQVLALRRFLIAARDARVELSHVMLVGKFPHALLVRTVNWRRRGSIKVDYAGGNLSLRDVRYLRSVPEAVAQTCDLVLSDLDGNWESLYVEGPVRLPSLIAVSDEPIKGGFITDRFTRGSVTYEDFFHVNDGRVDIAEIAGSKDDPVSIHVIPRDDDIDDECSSADLARENPIGRPDIVVSRLDASGVALSPRAEYLDEAGLPRSVSFEEDVPSWDDAPWRFDPALERQLLSEYFDRNHAYRTDPPDKAHRPASLAHDLPSGFRVVCRADPSWASVENGLPREVLDVKGRPSLAAAVDWFGQRAVLRTIRAHSDPWGSVFNKPSGRAGLKSLEEKAGNTAWSWTSDGNTLRPSLERACRGGKLDFFLLRTMWANGVSAGSPSFYIHTGCEAISPPGWRDRPWWDPAFGRRSGGNSVLFFAEGLAMVGRSKVFYDEPRGVAEALARGETFGDAWRGYFEIESDATSRGQVGGDIGRKRAYFWSVLGDGTLRLRRPEP